MKVIFISMLIAISSIVSHAQSYFSKRIDYFGKGEAGSTILYLDTGFIVSCGVADTNQNYRVGLTYLDTLGNVVWKKNYGIPDTLFFTGRPGASMIFSELNNKYYLAGGFQDTTMKNHGLLWAFDKNGDSLWTKYYSDTSNFYSFFQCKLTSDSSLILVGSKSTTSTQALLTKVDTLGNIIWEKVYGGAGSEYGCSVVEMNDHGFLIAGTSTTNSGSDVDMMTMKTDSLGNLQWIKYYNGNNEEYSNNYLIKLIDENFAFCGSLGGTVLGNSKLRIVKIDPLGNVIWDKNYRQDHWGTFINAITELSDSTIIGVGSSNEKSVIIKVKPNGDSIWIRSYRHPDINNGVNILYSLDLLNNDRIVAAGFVVPSGSDIGNQDLWVIKVDEWGCDTLSCQFVSVDENEIEKAIVKIYPNPATDFLYIEIDEEAYNSEAISFSIYDIVGKEILSIQARSKWESLDISQFANGTYIILVKKNNVSIGKSKFVKE
jgi:hypothetical protein